MTARSLKPFLTMLFISCDLLEFGLFQLYYIHDLNSNVVPNALGTISRIRNEISVFVKGNAT